MIRDYITKTDLINMYNDNNTNLKNSFVKIQKGMMLSPAYLQIDYHTGEFYLCDTSINFLNKDVFGPVIFETVCQPQEPDKLFYNNLDVILDGFNSNLKSYWDFWDNL